MDDSSANCTAKKKYLSSWEKATGAQKIESNHLLIIYNEI